MPRTVLAKETSHSSSKTPNRVKVAPTPGSSKRKSYTPRPSPTHRSTLALKEIRYYQRSTHLLLRRSPFGRVCREILLHGHPHAVEFRWQRQALECLQEAAEAFLVAFLSDSNLAAIHAKRVTLMVKDMHLIKTLKNYT